MQTAYAKCSNSNVELSDVPKWAEEIASFENSATYIEGVWGYSADSLEKIQSYEYKALMVNLVYSSLTESREVIAMVKLFKVENYFDSLYE